MDKNSGHVTPIVPGSLNPKADATPSDAYMSTIIKNILQRVLDVKKQNTESDETQQNNSSSESDQSPIDQQGMAVSPQEEQKQTFGRPLSSGWKVQG